MAISTMSPNYCVSKGEQIALNVDGMTSDETNTYSVYVCTRCSQLSTLSRLAPFWFLASRFPLFCRKMMDKQTFSSIQATTNTSRYAAGVFRKGPIR